MDALPPAVYPRDGLSFNQYTIKRHLMKMVGARFSIYGPGESLVLVADQKGFKLREEIRVFSDEALTRPVFGIFARQIIDFSAAYDVVDLVTNQKIAVYKRKGLRSIIQDEWILMDAYDKEVGTVIEDSLALALVRRFLTNLVPQNYDCLIQGQKIVDFRQNFNPFTYHLMVDFLTPPQQFDRRIGLAAAILLASIEGRQQG
ncbi:MAG TPA: hypothetical protein VK934_04225 [Fimbriimonas sp.]|nr:hypothetical protein [Fimbriimonas sp.]